MDCYCIILIAVGVNHSGAVFYGVDISVGVVAVAENEIENDQNNDYYQNDPPNRRAFFRLYI